MKWGILATGTIAEKFADIQREFDRTFKELFGGGKGTLELIDEDVANILTAPAQTYRHY